VLLLDASLQMGVCAGLLDLKPERTLLDAVRERDRLDETLIRQLTVQHESGLHLLAAPADAVEAAEVDDEAMSRVLTLARRSFDYVLVDTFPLLDRVIMSILDVSDRGYVVMEATVPTVLGASRLLGVLGSIGFPPERQSLVLNRYTRSTDNLQAPDVARRLGREIDHVIPYSKAIAIATNVGRPFVLSATTWWGAGRALYLLTQEVDAIRPLLRTPRAQPQARSPEANGALEPARRAGTSE
jgi:pilus assembly protein CpaE